MVLFDEIQTNNGELLVNDKGLNDLESIIENILG